MVSVFHLALEYRPFLYLHWLVLFLLLFRPHALFYIPLIWPFCSVNLSLYG